MRNNLFPIVVDKKAVEAYAAAKAVQDAIKTGKCKICENFEKCEGKAIFAYGLPQNAQCIKEKEVDG